MTTKQVILTETAIDMLNKLEGGREYKIVKDENGEIVDITIVGASPSKKILKSKRQFSTEIINRAVEQCLNSVKHGSMVMAFVLDKDFEPVLSNEIGEGYVIYGRKPIRVMNSVQEAVVELLSHVNDPDFTFVLRFKRRQNRWFIHTGINTSGLPVDFSLSKENPLRAYDLTKKQHLFEEKGGEE